MVKQLKNHKSIFGHPNPTHAVELLQKKTVSKHAEQMGQLKGGKAKLPITFVTIRLQ